MSSETQGERVYSLREAADKLGITYGTLNSCMKRFGGLGIPVMPSDSPYDKRVKILTESQIFQLETHSDRTKRNRLSRT